MRGVGRGADLSADLYGSDARRSTRPGCTPRLTTRTSVVGRSEATGEWQQPRPATVADNMDESYKRKVSVGVRHFVDGRQKQDDAAPEH